MAQLAIRMSTATITVDHARWVRDGEREPRRAANTPAATAPASISTPRMRMLGRVHCPSTNWLTKRTPRKSDAKVKMSVAPRRFVGAMRLIVNGQNRPGKQGECA